MPRSIAGLVLSAPPRPANGSCFTPRAHPHPAPQPRCRCRCLRSSPLRPGPARTGAAAFFFHPPPPSTFPRCRGAAGRAGTRSRCPGTGEGEPQRGGHRSRSRSSSRSSSGLGSSPGRGKKRGEKKGGDRIQGAHRCPPSPAGRRLPAGGAGAALHREQPAGPGGERPVALRENPPALPKCSKKSKQLKIRATVADEGNADVSRDPHPPQF